MRRLTEKLFKIEGMTCSACAKRIERFVGKIAGVDGVNVNFATEVLAVKFDEKLVKIKMIDDAIVKAGYKVAK
ncbi:MAG: heavy metal-associated domain-containing protein, partial [Oscillospiraceae bacterium]